MKLIERIVYREKEEDVATRMSVLAEQLAVAAQELSALVIQVRKEKDGESKNDRT